MKQAAIDDLDGSIWAKSAEFNITPEDVEKVLTNYNDNTDFASCGLNLAGQKYFFLSGNEDVLHGIAGRSGWSTMIQCCKDSEKGPGSR